MMMNICKASKHIAKDLYYILNCFVYRFLFLSRRPRLFLHRFLLMNFLSQSRSYYFARTHVISVYRFNTHVLSNFILLHYPPRSFRKKMLFHQLYARCKPSSINTAKEKYTELISKLQKMVNFFVMVRITLLCLWPGVIEIILIKHPEHSDM